MEKVPKIYAALQAVNNDLVAIEKEGKVAFGRTNFKFRGIDQVINTLGPLLKKHKILIRRTPAENPVTVTTFQNANGATQFRTILQQNYHFVSTEDGSEFVTYGAGVGADNLDKDLNCAISNAFKYVIFEMFSIPTEEQMDSDMKMAKDTGSDKKVEPPKKKPVSKPAEPTKSFRGNPVKPTGGL
jgi:hypothetical protein